jgi:hypothetical protein
MKYGIPIRLSSNLATHAREVADIADRSLTEQVEHWARLGQIVEASVSSMTVSTLKALSYDSNLPGLVAAADSPAARAATVADVRERAKGPVYGVAADDPDVIVRHDRDGTVTRGAFANGAFVPERARTARGKAKKKR